MSHVEGLTKQSNRELISRVEGYLLLVVVVVDQLVPEDGDVQLRVCDVSQ